MPLSFVCKNDKRKRYGVKRAVVRWYRSIGNPCHSFNWHISERVVRLAGWMYDYEWNFPVRITNFRPRVEEGHIIDSDFHVHSSNKRKPYAISLGPTFGNNPIATNPNDDHELRCGFRKRISPVMPLARIPRNFRGFVRSWLKKNLTPLPFINQEEEDNIFDDWLSSNQSYTASRKRQVREARQLYVSKSYKLEEFDYRVKSFIKREFYEAVKAVRLINSRSDACKVAFAPYIHCIEEQVYKSHHFVKGKPVSEFPDMMSSLDRYPFKLETDYSSFESGFSPEYVDCVECELFRYMLKNNTRALKQIMRCYYTVEGDFIVPRREILQSVSYHGSVIGSRMSGELWTSLANGFSNLMNMLFICHQRNIACDGFVEGDDGLFGLSSNEVVEADYERLGFKIKMLYGHNLTHTSFCGMYFDPTERLPVISPEQSCRLFWSSTPGYLDCRQSKRDSLLRAKAMSLYCQGKFSPISGPLAFKVLEILGKGPVTFDPHNVWWEKHVVETSKETFQPVTISQASRELFAARHHVPIGDQLMIEQKIREARTISDLSLDYRFDGENYPETEISRRNGSIF